MAEQTIWIDSGCADNPTVKSGDTVVWKTNNTSRYQVTPPQNIFVEGNGSLTVTSQSPSPTRTIKPAYEVSNGAKPYNIAPPCPGLGAPPEILIDN